MINRRLIAFILALLVLMPTHSIRLHHEEDTQTYGNVSEDTSDDSTASASTDNVPTDESDWNGNQSQETSEDSTASASTDDEATDESDEEFLYFHTAEQNDQIKNRQNQLIKNMLKISDDQELPENWAEIFTDQQWQEWQAGIDAIQAANKPTQRLLGRDPYVPQHQLP